MEILMFIVEIAILVAVLKILAFPLKVMFKFIVNSIIGIVILYVVAKMGIFVVIAWWSVLLTGFLGIPGAVISVILSIILF